MASIEGYWGIYSDVAPDELEIMHVGTNGRMVHEIVISHDPLRRIPMKVWFDHIANDDFEVRHKPDGDPWSLAIYTDDRRLIIEHKNGRQFEFERIALDDIPQAFQDTLKEANERMDAEETLAEQGESGS